MSFLNIVFKLSFILRTVDVSILSITVRHIILEFSLIDITFSMPKCTLAFRFVKEPLTFIMSSISPVLYAIAVPKLLNVWIVVHSAVAVALAGSIATIVSIGDLHLGSLVTLLHLASVDGIVRVDEHVAVDEARFVAEFGEQLLVSFHLNLVVTSH